MFGVVLMYFIKNADAKYDYEQDDVILNPTQVEDLHKFLEWKPQQNESKD